MSKKKTKIPVFKNEPEEARFWDTHDSTQFLDQMEEVHDIRFSEPKHESIVIDLESQCAAALKKLAHKKRLPYHSLIQRWIKEKVAQETA